MNLVSSLDCIPVIFMVIPHISFSHGIFMAMVRAALV